MLVLLDIFEVEAGLLKIETFNGCFNVLTSGSCKGLFDLMKAGTLTVSGRATLADETGRLSFVQFNRVRDGIECIPSLRLEKLDGYFHDVDKDLCYPIMRKAEKFDAFYNWLHAAFEKHREFLREVGYNMRHEKDTHWKNFEGKYVSRVRLDVHFPRVQRVRIDNTEDVTRVALDHVRKMPALRDVSMRGGIDETYRDRVHPGDPDSADGWGYSYANPPKFHSIVSVLGPSLERLDIDDCNAQFLGVFCDELATAIATDRFPSLFELSMRGTYQRVRKELGAPLMKALGACLSLRRVYLGEPTRFNKWQNKAAHDLRDTRPDLLVLCV